MPGQRWISLLLVKLVLISAVVYLMVKPLILIYVDPKKEVHAEDDKDHFQRAEAIVEDGKVELEGYKTYLQK